MTDPEPTTEEWAALYQAAVAFRNIGAWEWMYDSDLFGVENPETGEIGYCCVMGNLGEHFALGVYLGSEGLDGYLKIASGMFDPPDIAVLHYQTCLMASYEDRDYLERKDRDVIKSLGLRFRGRNAWPLFRSYQPDLLPWFVTAEEARFLTAALQQSVDVALRFKDDASLLDPPRKGHYLTRVPEESDNGIEWTDQWLVPAPLRRKEFTIPAVDEMRVQRVKQAHGKRRGGAWEADFFLTPGAIQEQKDQRPYYPYMLLWVDRGSGMVLPPEMASPGQQRAAFQEHFLTLLEQAPGMPKEVYVASAEAFVLLEPVAKLLGIKLHQSNRLPALEEARGSLMDYLTQM